MTPSEKLHELIHSLTKSEKRSFKILYSSGADAQDKNYIRLFDAVEAMDVYDEKKIKEIFKGETFIKQFTATKYYLYNLILKSLIYTRSLQAGHHHAFNLQSIPVLFQKKLYDHVLRITKLIKSKAYETENYNAVLEAIKWEERTNSFLPEFKDAYKKQHQLMLEKMDVIKRISNQAFYQSLKAKTFAFIKDERFLVKKEAFIKVQNEIFQELKLNPPIGNRSACDYHYVLGTLGFYNSDFTNSKKHYKSILTLLDKYPYLLEEPHNLNFLNSAQNYLVSAVQDGLFSEYDKQLIHRLKKEEKEHTANYLMVVRLEISFFMKQEYYHQAIELIEKNLNHEKELLQNDFYVIYGFWFDSLLAYFWKEDYRKAIYWINKITTYNKHELPFDILITTRLIEILIHFKLDDDYLVSSLSRSMIRLNEKKSAEFYINHKVLKLMHLIMNSSNDKRKENYLNSFWEEMQSKNCEKMLNSLKPYFDLERWLKKHVK